MEIHCPDCDRFVTPEEGKVSDPSFQPEEGYTYIEYVCPICNTVLLIERR